MIHPSYERLSLEEAQQLGQKRYREQQYGPALEAFSAVCFAV
jgi:hypothetical protein